MTDGSRQHPFLFVVSGMDAPPLEDPDVAAFADFYLIEPFHFQMPLSNEMLIYLFNNMINQINLHIATQPNLPFHFHYSPVFFEYGTILSQESQALYQEILSQRNSSSLNPPSPQSPPPLSPPPLSVHENSSVEDNGGTSAEACHSPPLLSVHDAMMAEGSQEACSHMHTPSNTPSLLSSFSATGPVVLSCSPLSFHSDFFSDDRQEISTTADHGSSGDDFDSEEKEEEDVDVEALSDEEKEVEALNATLLGPSAPAPFGQDGEEPMEGGPEAAFEVFFG